MPSGMLSQLFPIGDGKDAIRRIAQILAAMDNFFADTGCSTELPAATDPADFFADGFNEIWPEYCDSLWVYLDNEDVYAAFNKSTYEDIGPNWRLISTSNGLIYEEVGSVKDFAGSTIPAGYLECNGQAISRTTYAALFAVIGTTYGVGDGGTTFNLPDTQGRVIIDDGSGAGLTARTLGQSGGSETHTLSTSQLAAHQHNVTGTQSQSGGTNLPLMSTTGASASVTATNAAGSTGGGGSHNNIQPYLVLKKMIYAGV
jgi:microcystin-dependent protein